MDKMFLVENGNIIILRNRGIELVFNSKEEFKKYWPNIDISDKWYVDYEPERSIHIDSTDTNAAQALIPPYEEILENIEVIAALKNDPYFNTTLDEAKVICKRKIKNHFFKLILEGCTTSLGYKFDCDTRAISSLTNVVVRNGLKGSNSVCLIDFNNNEVFVSLEESQQILVEVGDYYEELLRIKLNFYRLIDSQTHINVLKNIVWA